MLLAACSGGGTSGGTGGGSGGGAGTGGGGNSALPDSVSLAPMQVRLGATETQQLSAIGHYSDGSMHDVTAAVTWASSAPSVATVNTAGLLTAVADGTADITATLSGKTATLGISVSGPALASLAISPDVFELGLGSTVQFVATGTFADSS
jgi:hypothetical protein